MFHKFNQIQRTESKNSKRIHFFLWYIASGVKKKAWMKKFRQEKEAKFLETLPWIFSVVNTSCSENSPIKYNTFIFILAKNIWRGFWKNNNLWNWTAIELCKQYLDENFSEKNVNNIRTAAKIYGIVVWEIHQASHGSGLTKGLKKMLFICMTSAQNDHKINNLKI